MPNIVDMKTVFKFLGIDILTTADKNIELIRDATEAWVQNVYCRKNLVATSYKEQYDGTGGNYLSLDNYPITAVNRLSIDTDDAISILNTNTGAVASVSVSSSAVSLYKDGTTTSLSFTTYSTLTTLVAAINATSGWSASLMSSNFGSYPSTVLMTKFGLSSINNNTVYLPMPSEDSEDDFDVDVATGIIYSPFGFPAGRRNIFVDYSAGYSTIPDDAQMGTLILIKNLYQRRSEESFGLSSYSVSGISQSFKDGVPQEAERMLSKYRRIII